MMMPIVSLRQHSLGIDYLTHADMQALLDAPDPRTPAVKKHQLTHVCKG
jgi:hypothetical protein